MNNHSCINQEDLRLTLRETADFLRVNYRGRRAVLELQQPVEASVAVTVADVELTTDVRVRGDDLEVRLLFDPDPAFSGFADSPALSLFGRSFLRGRYDEQWDTLTLETSSGSILLRAAGP